MSTNDLELRLWRRFRSASAKLGKGLSVAEGGKKAEEEYGQAYQQLVLYGFAPQLRHRYRKA